MTITAQSILERAATILQDSGIRWPVAELVQWFNDGQREVCLYKPEASVANASIQLAALTTKQTLPESAIGLVDVVCNMGVDGQTRGGAVRMIERGDLDRQKPDWHTATAASAIKHAMFDPRNPRNFYVYPRPSTAIYIEAVYNVLPADVTVVGGVATGNLAVDGLFASAVLDFVLFRAFNKESEVIENVQRAAAHKALFNAAVGVRNQADAGSLAKVDA